MLHLLSGITAEIMTFLIQFLYRLLTVRSNEVMKDDDIVHSSHLIWKMNALHCEIQYLNAHLDKCRSSWFLQAENSHTVQSMHTTYCRDRTMNVMLSIKTGTTGVHIRPVCVHLYNYFCEHRFEF